MRLPHAFEHIHEFYNSLLFYVVPVCIAGGRPLGILEFAPGSLDWSGPAKVTADSAASSMVIFAERGGIEAIGFCCCCCSLEAGGWGLRLSRAVSILRAGKSKVLVSNSCLASNCLEGDTRPERERWEKIEHFFFFQKKMRHKAKTATFPFQKIEDKRFCPVGGSNP